MKVRINWSELAPALYGLGWQIVVVVLIAIVAPSLHATVEEVFCVVAGCFAVIAAQAAIHLIAAYVRMAVLLNCVGPAAAGKPKSALASCWRR